MANSSHGRPCGQPALQAYVWDCGTHGVQWASTDRDALLTLAKNLHAHNLSPSIPTTVVGEPSTSFPKAPIPLQEFIANLETAAEAQMRLRAVVADHCGGDAAKACGAVILVTHDGLVCKTVAELSNNTVHTLQRGHWVHLMRDGDQWTLGESNVKALQKLQGVPMCNADSDQHNVVAHTGKCCG